MSIPIWRQEVIKEISDKVSGLTQLNFFEPENGDSLKITALKRRIKEGIRYHAELISARLDMVANPKTQKGFNGMYLLDTE